MAPIVVERRNPARNRAPPHFAGDSQPTPPRRGLIQRRIVNQPNFVIPMEDLHVPNDVINNLLPLNGNNNVDNADEENEENIENNIEENDVDADAHNSDAVNRAILKEALFEAARGNPPVKQLRNQAIVKKFSNQMVEKINKNNLVLCSICTERWFEEKGGVRLDMDQYHCQRCHKETTVIKKFSKENNMSPMWHPMAEARNDLRLLQKYYPLTYTEEAVIGLSAPIMCVMKLAGPIGGSNTGFSGNVVNILQDIAPLCFILPRLLSNVDIITVRSKRGTNPGDYKDFKVRRNHVYRWLCFLKRWNPVYANITINNENLLLLPENGSVMHLLMAHENNNVHENNDNNNNNAADSDDEDGVQAGPINELGR